MILSEYPNWSELSDFLTDYANFVQSGHPDFSAYEWHTKNVDELDALVVRLIEQVERGYDERRTRV